MLQIESAQNLAQNSSQTRGWHGQLQLDYAPVGSSTQLIQSQVRAPLKVQRPFYPEGETVCHSVILHTAGGIVGGDRLSLFLHLQPASQALVTTAAAAKVYRSNGQEAIQQVTAEIGPGACLEWLPQDTIVFEQARYRQQMRIELAPGATWVGWDITRFGRSARGERFLAGDWRSHTEVWQAGKPLWLDRQWLPGSTELFHSPHGLAGCPVVGSFALLGQAVEPDLVAQARSLWQGAPGISGVTRLQSGLLARYRGDSTVEARQWFLALWDLLRPVYAQRPACIPRVWQIGQSC